MHGMYCTSFTFNGFYFLSKLSADVVSSVQILQNVVLIIKGKSKVIPLQARCDPAGGYRYSSTLS